MLHMQSQGVKANDGLCAAEQMHFVRAAVHQVDCQVGVRKVGLFPPRGTPPDEGMQRIKPQILNSPDEGMQCISVGDPANQPRVGREGYNSISGDAEIPLSSGPVIGQHAVD